MHPRVRIGKKTIVDFVASHPLSTIATVGKEGLPELASVYVHIEKDLTLYFLSKEKTRKIKNIARKPRVTMLTVDAEALTTVEIEGTVVPVEDTLEFAHVYDVFHELFGKRHPDCLLPPLVQIKGGACRAYKITPKRMCYRIFSTFDTPSREYTLKT